MMNIVVLLGGDSAEREISLQSGHAVATALKSRGHCVKCFDPAEFDLRSFDWAHWDVVFIALHGTFGEDGQVQTILDQKNIPYTGSNAMSSRLAFHKSLAQKVFEENGILVPAMKIFNRNSSAKQITENANELGYPLFIKPEAQGSSFGVSYIEQPSDLKKAAQECLKFDTQGLIQKAIRGSEWTLAIFEKIVFPIIQIQFQETFYDHEAKYEDEKTRFLLDENSDSVIPQKLISTGEKAYRAIGASGIARVDLILDDRNNAWVLEVNTIPGMTDHSTVPKAAQKFGWDFATLCEKSCLAAIGSRSK